MKQSFKILEEDKQDLPEFFNEEIGEMLQIFKETHCIDHEKKKLKGRKKVVPLSVYNPLIGDLCYRFKRASKQ